MRTLAFDGRMGASGDMLLAALLAAGADRNALAPIEDALDVRYEVDRVDEHGIAATAVRVVLDDGSDGAHGHTDHHHGGHASGHSHTHDDSDGHSHTHDDSDGHSHTHDDSDGHSHTHDGSDGHSHTHDAATPAEGHGPHRTYAEVVDIVGSMDLPASVESDAIETFQRLGEAESSVHDTDLESTPFHEVGADDAIADVVGVALLVEDLGVGRIATTPLATGGGTASMAHGEYPIPAPAVVEIAAGADWSLRGGPVDAELLTPTGAAILAQFADGVESLPALNVDAVGYGAGGYTFPDRPNVLRALVGDGGRTLNRESITVLETNLDDAPPEVLGDLQRSLTDAGARDVTILPTTMKKSRPGHLVKVIVKPGDTDRVARRLAVETGTLGVREHGAGHRWIADREFRTAELSVDGETHEVTVKVASDQEGEVYDYSAEYDDAAAVAAATGLPVREVLRRAEAAVRPET
ncbi:nickel pincer cofactor biosynthesis protein LarC [Halobellus salinus]|uniref:nickel pincer cofactor biosynthesis protein LarC n=1 Tax=Halobellus salinus TaxID=931585 RepID=UPI002403791D|nr:nickel pincer cofactor biosynthesis protein LarC [Halobellus salinus]SMP16547.1 hypothetical protein SAMN06265347_1064 [Halobellus salinus]